MRFYYKTKDNTAWFNLKTPVYEHSSNHVKLTEKQWNDHIAELERNKEGE